MTHIVVREYAKLTTREVAPNSLDLAHIPASAFDWLCRLRGRWGKDDAALLHLDDTRTLRLDNYVGLLESPCGTRLEILPKIHAQEQAAEESRALLCRMLQSVWQLPVREGDVAHLRLLRRPLNEWIIRQFLLALSHLLKRGLSSQYQRVAEERTFVRGQINMPRQMRQLPHRQHLTHVKHDIFLLNRPENCLLRTALLRCRSATQDTDNWGLAASLDEWMHHVPVSEDIQQDLRQWCDDRHMAYYASVRPWCELVLGNALPATMEGRWQGISLLFPMEKLFEAFVERALATALRSGGRLRAQSRQGCLCWHGGSACFRLQPDMLVEYEDTRWVLDAKWKLLNASEKYHGLSQADFYQMFAYGHNYLDGQGEMALIYPYNSDFAGLELPFVFSENMKLHVLAFDLDKATLVSPPEGFVWLQQQNGFSPAYSK